MKILKRLKALISKPDILENLIEQVSKDIERNNKLLMRIYYAKIDGLELRDHEQVMNFAKRMTYAMESLRDELRIMLSNRTFTVREKVEEELPEHMKKKEDQVYLKLIKELEQKTGGDNG